MSYANADVRCFDCRRCFDTFLEVESATLPAARSDRAPARAGNLPTLCKSWTRLSGSSRPTASKWCNIRLDTRASLDIFTYERCGPTNTLRALTQTSDASSLKMVRCLLFGRSSPERQSSLTVVSILSRSHRSELHASAILPNSSTSLTAYDRGHVRLVPARAELQAYSSP
jgi:hypothetical protein